MNMRLLMVLSLASLAGCFSPNYTNGLSQCGPKGECPEGFECAPDHHCYSPGTFGNFDLSNIDLTGFDLGQPDLTAGEGGITCGANQHVCNDGCALNSDVAT